MLHLTPLKSLGATCIVMVSLVQITGCVSQNPPCEEILEVKRQHQECVQLRKVMERKDYPQQALTAQKRYEAECTNLRYYRDDFDTICKGNERPIGATVKDEQ